MLFHLQTSYLVPRNNPIRLFNDLKTDDLERRTRSKSNFQKIIIIMKKKKR